MTEPSVLVEKAEGVGTIVLNRPDALNAMDLDLTEGLSRAVEECEGDAAVRVVVIVGAGRAFSAGGDLRGMTSSKELDPPGYLKRLTLVLHPAISCLTRMPKPVIARVQGAASGAGLSLMLACDLVVAAESARFNTAYMRVALSPDGSSTYFLPRLVGLKKALELFLLCETIDAAEALRLGLVNRVVPDAELEGITTEMARRLARGPALAMAKAKELVYRSLGESLESQMENEGQAIVVCGGSDDFQEGAQAFFEKREARFR
jgi:2-(1,2-epoxy-1,2-dihydrophenyl)acetyl-CoA isomerase